MPVGFILGMFVIASQHVGDDAFKVAPALVRGGLTQEAFRNSAVRAAGSGAKQFSQLVQRLADIHIQPEIRAGVLQDLCVIVDVELSKVMPFSAWFAHPA